MEGMSSMALPGQSVVPPGFRFHPTDEELVGYYLRKKVACSKIDLDVIREIDLYKLEPWDLQEKCRIGSGDQNEWYFFSHKDKKYPTGTRTNRATTAGFWKATGRDKAIFTKVKLIGMRKTLVFYKGRAPNGQKSDWIMHEYRLEDDINNTTTSEEGWVVCRVFKKRNIVKKPSSDFDGACCYDEQVPDLESPEKAASAGAYYSSLINNSSSSSIHQSNSVVKQEEIDQTQGYYFPFHQLQDPFSQQLPRLESPKHDRMNNNSSSSNMMDQHRHHHNSGSSRGMEYGHLCELEELVHPKMSASSAVQDHHQFHGFSEDLPTPWGMDDHHEYPATSATTVPTTRDLSRFPSTVSHHDISALDNLAQRINNKGDYAYDIDLWNFNR